MDKRKAGMPKNILESGVTALGYCLSLAWVKYTEGFGEPPHGTPEQLSALIELAGGEDMLIRVGRATEVAKMARGMRKLSAKAKGKRS